MSNRNPVAIKTADGQWLLWHRNARSIPASEYEAIGVSATNDHEWLIWHHPDPPTAIEWEIETVEWLDKWTIKPDFESLSEAKPGRFPAKIEGHQYYEMEDEDDIGFYNRASRSETTTRSLDLDGLQVAELEAGELAPEALERKRSWRVGFPAAILEHPSIHPWLPGRLVGLRARVATELDSWPSVADVYCKRPASSYEPENGPYANLLIPHPGTSLTAPARGKKAKGGWLTVKFDLSQIPTVIEAKNLAEAAKQEQALFEYWIEQIRSINADKVVCPTCKGEGVRPVKAEG